MNKVRTNALEALRALIAERQQYEQWIATLESKRDGTPPHVFERVHGDYTTRLQKVVTDIKGHAEELQSSISALSSRLVEVAREEDTRRDALQEAELRAAVGEYEPQQWEKIRTEAERGLEKVATDRGGLDSQLSELRSIQKLSEVGSVGDVAAVAVADLEVEAAPGSVASDNSDAVGAEPVELSDGPQAPAAVSPPLTDAPARVPEASSAQGEPPVVPPARDQGRLSPDKAAPASASPSSATPAAAPAAAPAQRQQTRSGKTPPFGSAIPTPRPVEPRGDQSKTLKCPECGTANYATEWYCERCGGELATM